MKKRLWKCSVCGISERKEPHRSLDAHMVYSHGMSWNGSHGRYEPISIIEKPSELREMTASLAEHEVLLSFVDDVDAELFSEWWNATGFLLFKEYGEKNKP